MFNILRQNRRTPVIVVLIPVLVLTCFYMPALSSNNHVYAEESTTEYQITYDANGGSGTTTQMVVSGQAIEKLPANPTKKGNAFLGWYTAKSGGTKISAGYMVTGNERFYAHWKARKYTIKFNANGGKVSKKSKTVTFGKKYGSLPDPTKSRSKFLGWYTGKSGGTKIIKSKLVSITSTTTLYAKWKNMKTFKYNFNANGGKVSTKSKSYKYGSKIKSLPIPQRANFTFMGWYTNTHGGSRVYNGQKVKSKLMNQTIYARWAPKQYFQYDSRWGGNTYIRTVASSGCGPSTMSMVVASIKKGSVNPAIAARWSIANGYRTSAPGKTKDGFFTKFPGKYGIKSTRLNTGNLKYMSKSKANKLHAKTKEAVKNGDWVVAFMDPGAWTHHGHFILWYDIEGSRALVRDPNASKASKTRNKISVLQSQAKRYWIISVPYSKMISPPTKGKVVGTSTLAVRSKASSSSKKHGVLKKGQKITITNKKNNMWKIKYNGKTGYVPQKYITVTK